MGFSPKVKEEALFRSKRHCCLCHQFAGRGTNVHHIMQEADSGSDEIDNAAVLCLRCHGEVGHYNPHHPIGNKYNPSVVRRRRDEWWEWCKEHPFAPGPDDPITVSPSVIPVAGGNWGSREILTIYNRTEQTFYAIWLKFQLSAGPFAVAELVFDKPTWSQVSLPVGPAEVVADCVGVHGPDSQGNENLYIILERIGPKASLALGVTIKKERVVEAKRQIPVQVIAWSEEPRSVLQRNGTEVSLVVQIPEEFKLRGFLLHWNRV